MILFGETSGETIFLLLITGPVFFFAERGAFFFEAGLGFSLILDGLIFEDTLCSSSSESESLVFMALALVQPFLLKILSDSLSEEISIFFLLFGDGK